MKTPDSRYLFPYNWNSLLYNRNDEATSQDHYDDLREIYAGNDATFNAGKNRRREQYIKPLKAIQ